MSKSKLRKEYEARFGVVDGMLRLYDAEGNIIYCEYSDDFWVKSEYDDKGNEIYREYTDGYWVKSEYDDKGNEIYYENSCGWSKYEYDAEANIIYCERSDDFWEKYEYDDKSKAIYRENSVDGVTLDNRPCDSKVFIDEQTGKKFKMTEVK